MASDEGVPSGLGQKCLTTEDLNPCQTNLTKTREMTSIIGTALQQLNAQFHNVSVGTAVTSTIDTIKRRIRRCQETVEAAMESARCYQELSATYIEQGRFGDALESINDGLIVLGRLKKPLVSIRDSLNNLSSKGLTDGLKQVGIDKEIEAWDGSINEWTARMAMPTWNKADLDAMMVELSKDAR